MNVLDTMKSTSVALNTCDTDDATYEVPSYEPLDSLMASIQRVGILQPPVLQEQTDGRLIPVLGRRRLQAMKRLGMHEVTVHLLPSTLGKDHCFRLAFWDNLPCRSWNAAVTAVVVRKLLELFSPVTVAQEFLPVLRIPPKGPMLQRLVSIGSLEPVVLEALAAGRIHEKTALILSRMKPTERLTLLELTERLKLNVNKRGELIEHLFDLAVFHRTDVLGFLEDPEVRALLAEEEKPAVQRGDALRASIRRKKFPEIAVREAQFTEWLKRQGTIPGITVRPDPNFEGNGCTVEVRLENWEQAAKLLATARNLLAVP